MREPSECEKFGFFAIAAFLFICVSFTVAVTAISEFEVFDLRGWDCSKYLYPDQSKGELFQPYCIQFTMKEAAP